MRNLLAPLVLIPALALAQTPPPAPPAPPTAPQPAPGERPSPTRPPPAPPTAPGVRPGFGPTGQPLGPPVRAPNQAQQPPAPGRPPGQVPQQPAKPTQPSAPSGKPGQAETLRPDSKCVPLQGHFMLSFNKADIVDVLEQASRWTCRNFVYTEDIARGKITLLSKTPVTADEAYAAFLVALNANNIAVYATGRYYKLIRTADSKKTPIPTYTGDSETPASEQPITKVIRLQYVDADQMRGVVGNFISPQGADVQSIPPDMLIITDIGLNIRRIERILDAVDRAGAGDLVRIVQIRYASAKDIADKINQIFQAQGGKAARRALSGTTGVPRAGIPPPAGAPPSVAAPPAPAPTAGAGPVEVSVSKILPDERTNKLIIIADEKSFQKIMELIEQLDVPGGAEGGIHVVFLRNANAEELAQTLSNLATGKRPTGAAAVPIPAAMPPGAPKPPGAPSPTGGAPPGEVTAELFSGEVKVTADKPQNALLIQASGADFNVMKRLIDKLDRARRQIFVEAVIVEVNLRNDLHLGVGAHAAIPFNYKGDTGIIPIASEPGQVSSLNLASVVSLGGFLTGFSGPVTTELKNLGINIPSIGFLVQALQTSSDANVLSTPHLVATDNEESEISVGQNVPFQAGYSPAGLAGALTGGTTPTTGTTQGAATALGAALGAGGFGSLIAPIQRQPVELRLKIKPQINEGGNVRLNVEAQNEEITERDPVLGPTTAKRTVKTQVVAHDQDTIVIGGLIQERSVRSVKKIPLLGSLPLIGWLFRDTSNTKTKTNLLIFLTPYIIRDESDYRRIYERKRKEQQQFIEQFYGRQAPFEVEIDFARKPGPYTRMRTGVQEETSKVENGGRGAPGERVTRPPGEAPPGEAPPAPGVPVTPPRTPPRPAPEEGAPPDRLEVQPEVPAPGEAPPPVPPPPPPSPQTPEGGAPPG